MNRPELAFLPAALEIQETPPSPLGRAIVWTIVALFAIAVAWACIGKVDIVAVARGKIIPAGHSKVVQPLGTGVVTAIHVKEGQRVKAGDPLIDLDPTVMQADQDRLQADWMSAKASQARLRALLSAALSRATADGPSLTAPEGVSATVAEIQRRLMRNQYQEQQANETALSTAINQKNAEHAAVLEEIEKLEAVLPIVTQRAESLKTLAAQKLAAENDYLVLEQERIEKAQELAVLENRVIEIQEAIKQSEAEHESLRAEFKSSLYAEQAETDARIAGLEQELIKARTNTALQQLRAPVDGVIQQLAVHTVGGVVTPAQPLMVIVPDEKHLVVEAYVLNKDIGFVAENQAAEIKVDAFPFTRYGTIDGAILNVSDDAVENKKLGWAFLSRVSMAQSDIAVEGKQVNLSPGMSVTVEVKTGKRRIIEFFLSPLLRYSQESIKEH